MLILKVGVLDLAGTRFAMSPISETILAVQLLKHRNESTINLSWVRWARAELERRSLRIPRLWPLIVSDRPTWPEFLAPAPDTRYPAIAEELTRMQLTSTEQVSASLRRVFGAGPWPDSATQLLERPYETLAEIAADLAECHDRLIAPHWERIRSVLDADIAYRASGLLASGGAGKLFNDLHPDVHWSAGTLTAPGVPTEGQSGRRVVLGPDGLVLVPSVFVWPRAVVKMTTATQTTVRYPARGAATVWYADSPAPEAVKALLGSQRAWLLRALRSPSVPGALARELGVTSSAVSQHLKVLYRAGLVDRQRTGRRVLYFASDLGMTLLSRAGQERS
jgi:DNA-binding transcriptional ArsR family regulator